MTLKEIRGEIDAIDAELLPLFLRRMKCAERVAAVKREQKLPVFNEKREREILDGIARSAGEYGGEARALFSDLLAMSRAAQHRLLGSGAPLREAVERAPRELPKAETVACLGKKGSFSHEALLRLYPDAQPLFFPDFPAVFRAVETGRAGLGVLPVENSSAGSVGEVYDLILKYRFSIAGALSLPVRHCLASAEPVLENVRVVYSHPQALRQCSEFLTAHRLKTEPFSSTAEAAEAAGKPGAAAVCSLRAAGERGLNILARDIQNTSANRTRFLAVGRRLCLPPDADKISLCFSLPHRTGTLSAVLARFAAAGLNLTKIESRPIPGKNFEYDFYLDFAGDVRDGHTLDLLCALRDELPLFTFLGNYREIS
ncbi:MAG: chorismate mutase [Oscillospiraceae bacterium]|jgi:chorismate mutase/prephenate dehydratase|nr:chorismate mutase [Oscillospiraceae bacterium]MCI1989772.1 chorismate mutase [Oscillospiraceae bacterium]MCI2034375.1 chorismate mutase [Oscillospiraceae bacterium]